MNIQTFLFPNLPSLALIVFLYWRDKYPTKTNENPVIKEVADNESDGWEYYGNSTAKDGATMAIYVNNNLKKASARGFWLYKGKSEIDYYALIVHKKIIFLE